MAKMANSDDAGDVIAFPAIGLLDPLSLELIAVACGTDDEDDTGFTFPVAVTLEVEPVSEGKFPGREEGWIVVRMTCEFEGGTMISGRIISEGKGENGGNLLEAVVVVAALAAVDLMPKPKQLSVISQPCQRE